MRHGRLNQRGERRTPERAPEPGIAARPAVASAVDAVIALQAAAGNAAVTRRLQRRDEGLVVPHQDARIVDAAAFQSAYGELPRTGRTYIDEWLAMCHLGAWTVPEPSLLLAPLAWYWALGSNIAWGLTGMKSYFWPAAVATAAISSASSLSGLGAPADTRTIGRTAIGDALARAGDAMEQQVLHEAVLRIARRCGAEGVGDRTAQDRLLWGEMFPGVPFENRRERIAQDAARHVTAALAELQSKYEKWLDEVSMVTGGGANRYVVEYLERVHPFHPKLASLERLQPAALQT